MQTNNMKFNVARIITCSEVEGPFKRLAIWFQGCDILCKGCCNPELQALKKANILNFDQLLNIILNAKKDYDIEGVTFCGGEPSLQQHLPLLANKLRDLGIGTIMFSGHYIEELPSELVNSMDMILDGPFVLEELETERRLLGSKNQRISLVTNRYKEYINWFFDKKELIEEINLSDVIEINGDALVDNKLLIN